jgi:hypothetical protein
MPLSLGTAPAEELPLYTLQQRSYNWVTQNIGYRRAPEDEGRTLPAEELRNLLQ